MTLDKTQTHPLIIVYSPHVCNLVVSEEIISQQQKYGAHFPRKCNKGTATPALPTCKVIISVSTTNIYLKCFICCKYEHFKTQN